MSAVKAPTLIVQGQKNSLFNLQEAAATYRGLQAQGTPVQMIWQSWGHSFGGDPAPGELDLTGTADLRSTYLGGRFLDWFNRYVKDDTAVTTGPEFSYFQDWVTYSGTATPAYASSESFPVGKPLSLYLSGATDLVTATADVTNGSQSWADGPAGSPTSDSETSSQGGASTDPLPGPRRTRHVRVLDLRAGRSGHGHGRVADPRGDPGLQGCCRHPGGWSRRAARRLPEDLRRGAGRHPDAAQPPHLADPNRRRDPAGPHRAARRRPALREGAPHPARPGRQRRGVRREHRGPAGHRRRRQEGPGGADAPGGVRARTGGRRCGDPDEEAQAERSRHRER